MDKCVHIKKLQVTHNHSVFNPQKWLCKVCGTTESVWACLSCTNVACGRYNEEHAVKHFQESKHPLAIEVNDRYVFCYECDDYILNDNAPGDLKLLRTTLDAITKQTLYESQTRSGRRLLRALSVDTGEQIKHRRQESLTWEDKGHTALVHRRLVLLSYVFLPWKHLVHGNKVTGKKPKPKPQKRTLTTKTAKDTPRDLKEAESSLKRRRLDDLRSQEVKRKWTALTPGVTGLRNLGNTCYMNSILQVLGHLQQFRECFLHLELNLRPQLNLSQSVGTRRQMEYMRQTTMECFEEVQKPKGGMKSKGRILRQPGTSAGGLSGGSDEAVDPSKYKDPRTVRNNFPLCHELHVLYRVMWSGKWAIVSPHAILSSVWRLIPSFRGYSQQDAQEFLCEFLDKIHNELQYVSSAPSIQMASGTSIPTKDIIGQSFEGGLVSQVTCLQCLNKSNTFEPLGDLSLEFPERYQFSEWRTSLSEASCHLTEMLAKFTEREHLGKVYACERCNSRRRNASCKPEIRTEATKRLLLTKLPLVLRLHLKRFRWCGRNHREKINVHVNFEEELNMRPYCYVGKEDESRLTNEDFIYDLSTVVIHHGRGFGSGHYTAYCWNKVGGFWVHCNDARLELCSIEDVTLCQAYILFYTKRTSTVAHVGQPRDSIKEDEVDGPSRTVRKRRFTL
ncbi:ubiquitin carboxyl-terminal hydrolase 44-like [Patiria miniata]|uniref:ubiquitinyl hydrolase 1 n=1 Tax=Patiria miniata TaxID=46514 RepID=A0A913ZQA5_PATMI|nr:ubiquitin carboxyl-terminal hydrolase 44-like [Patiria miniata]